MSRNGERGHSVHEEKRLRLHRHHALSTLLDELTCRICEMCCEMQGLGPWVMRRRGTRPGYSRGLLSTLAGSSFTTTSPIMAGRTVIWWAYCRI